MPPGENDLPTRLQLIRGVALRHDTGENELSQASVTLGAANVITTITLPSWARGFRLTPSALTRFAVDEDPPAIAALSGAAINATNFTAGNTAVANVAEPRLLRPQVGDTARTLRLRSSTAAAVVVVELF